MAKTSSVAASKSLPFDCCYGLAGGFAWKDYLIAVDRICPGTGYEVSIYSPKLLDWLLLVSPDGYHIRFDNSFEAMRAAWEWVEIDIGAEGPAVPLSALDWRYERQGLSNGMALWLIGENSLDASRELKVQGGDRP